MERQIVKNGKTFYTIEHFRLELIKRYNHHISERTASRYMQKFKSIDGHKRPRLFSYEIIEQAIAGYSKSLETRKYIDVNETAFGTNKTKVSNALIFDTFNLIIEDLDSKKINAKLDYLLKLHGLEFDENQLIKDHYTLTSNEKGAGTPEENKAIRNAYTRYVENNYFKEKKQDI